MATAYSTLLGLALPVQGELSGTWGDMVDNGITRYVDIAVAGTVTLTNDGAVTLSLTNGDSSATNIVSSLTGAGTVSAQFAIIKVTGTLTTAKVLTPPSSSRTYVVVNAATGSTVTVKASGQTGVSIAVGETAFVYFNGTDYVKVAGTVNTGVTSFQTSLSGLTPSTATTGAVTLAGTLGTANGGTGLTSFTSGGVVYASSSSVLATGSALTFNGTTLGINSSTLSAWSVNYRALQSGNGSAFVGFNGNDQTFVTSNAYNDGAWKYINTSGAGFYVVSGVSNGVHAWFTAPSGTAGTAITFTQAMTLSAGGNLVIGDTTGNGRLSVRDSSAALQEIYTTAGTGYAALEIKNGSGGVYLGKDNSAGSFFASGTGYASCLYSYGAFPLVFFTNGTERARITAAGGFSVGTTADPGAGAIYATGNITAYYSDARLKTVSGKIENALDKVAQLSGVYYTNNAVAKSFGYDSDEVQVGVLAQDVEAVLPQIVKAAPFDLDQDGNSKSGKNYKTVQYERLVPLLIEAINELQAKVKALESK